MILQRQLAVGALYFLLAAGAGYSQYIVKVAFAVTGRNGKSSCCFEIYFLELRATRTIEGRSSRSFSL